MHRFELLCPPLTNRKHSWSSFPISMGDVCFQCIKVQRMPFVDVSFLQRHPAIRIEISASKRSGICLPDFFGMQDIIISTFQSPSKQIYPSGMFWRSDSPVPLDKASPEETETPCGWDEDQIQMQLAEKLPGIANAFVSSSPADLDINESSPSSLDELETYIHDLLQTHRLN
jgi:hypothetical protein